MKKILYNKQNSLPIRCKRMKNFFFWINTNTNRNAGSITHVRGTEKQQKMKGGLSDLTSRAFHANISVLGSHVAG